MVSMGCAPPFLLLVTKSSALAPGVAGESAMLSKVPVGGVIVRVELPVVTRLGIAAGAVQWRIQIEQLA